MIKAVETLWIKYKDRKPPTTKLANTRDQGKQQRLPDEYDWIAKLLDIGMDDLDQDEFNHFITADPIKIDCNPLKWWYRYEQCQAFP